MSMSLGLGGDVAAEDHKTEELASGADESDGHELGRDELALCAGKRVSTSSSVAWWTPTGKSPCPSNAGSGMRSYL